MAVLRKLRFPSWSAFRSHHPPKGQSRSHPLFRLPQSRLPLSRRVVRRQDPRPLLHAVAVIALLSTRRSQFGDCRRSCSRVASRRDPLRYPAESPPRRRRRSELASPPNPPGRGAGGVLITALSSPRPASRIRRGWRVRPRAAEERQGRRALGIRTTSEATVRP